MQGITIKTVVEKFNGQKSPKVVRALAGIYGAPLPTYLVDGVMIGGESTVLRDRNNMAEAILISNEPFRAKVPGGRRLSAVNSKLYCAMYQGLVGLVPGREVLQPGEDPLRFTFRYEHALDNVALSEYRRIREFIRRDGTDWKSNLRPYVNKNQLKEQILEKLC